MNKYKNHILVGIGILILLFSLQRCNSNKLHKLEGEYRVLKEQYQTQKDGVKVIQESRKKEKDSLQKIIFKRDKETTLLLSLNNSLEDRLLKNKSRPINVPKDIIGLTRFFNERYKTNENEVVGNKVGLSEFTAYDVSYELDEGDRAEESVVIQDSIIKNQKQIISNLGNDKKDLNFMIDSAEKEIEARIKLQESAEKNIENLNKQNKKLKTKSTLNKILIPVALISGGFLGYQLGK